MFLESLPTNIRNRRTYRQYIIAYLKCYIFINYLIKWLKLGQS